MAAIGTAAATAVTAIALTLAATIAMRAVGLTPRPGVPGSRGGTPQVFRQAITESFIVYGKRRVAGLIVFFHSKKSGDAHLRYFVIAVAGHRCKGVVSWLLNDETVTVDGGGAVTTGKYAGHAWLWFQRGLSTETANSTFVSECDGKWTAAHRGDGTAAIYAKFHMTNDVVEAGLPNISAVIEGKDDILDTRDATEKYTNNAVLVFYDWMQLPREEGGFGAYADEIPDDAWISANANVCDEDVSIPGGGTENRYELDAFIITGANPADIRDTMILNQGGSYSYANGKHLMRPGYYVAPNSDALLEADLVGSITVSAFDQGDITANRVEGTFVDPANAYQGQAFPSQATAGAVDIRQLDVDFGFVTSRYRAARIASIMLKRAEAEKTVQWPMNIAGLKVMAMDTVLLDTERYGLSNYAFTVKGWGMSADYSIHLSLREENEEIYGAPSLAAPTAPPDLTVPTGGLTDAEKILSITGSTVTGSGASLTASDAGTTASIAVGAHTRRYADKEVSVNSGNVTGLSFATGYHVYYDDENRLGGAVTYAASTTASTAQPSTTNPGRHYVGFVTTPADGASNTTGTGFGAPYVQVPGGASPAASAVTFSPTGGIAATNVQSAIAEVDTEKAPKASPVFTGSVTWADGVYHGSADAKPRIFFNTNSYTLNRAGNNSGQLHRFTRADNTEIFYISDTGVFSPVHPTTASAANMHVDSGTGQISRSTSSRRYKRNIEGVEVKYVEAIKALRPVSYQSQSPIDNQDWSWWGLIAEEVAEIDPRLVHWGYERSDYRKDGKLKKRAKLMPTGVQYERLAVLQHGWLQQIDLWRFEVDEWRGSIGTRVNALEQAVFGKAGE